MITSNQVNKVYRTKTIETTALHSVNLEIPEGEFLSIMGPSGRGKSTLLNIIGLLDAPTSGQVQINESNPPKYNTKSMVKFRNKKLGFIFQGFHLIPDLSVSDNIELPLFYRKTSSKERRKLAEEALESVGLKNRMSHFPSQLSDGQKHRVTITRAIVGKPQKILTDQPTGNLDSVMGNEVMDILMHLNSENNITIVMVTHDENMAKKTHKLMRLYDGQQVA